MKYDPGVVCDLTSRVDLVLKYGMCIKGGGVLQREVRDGCFVEHPGNSALILALVPR